MRSDERQYPGYKRNREGGSGMRRLVWLIFFIALGCASGGHSGSSMRDYAVEPPEGWREVDVSGVFIKGF